MSTVYEYVGPPLTRDGLASLFDRLGVQPRAYSLFGAHEPDANVMDHRREGWVVFYTERGDESRVETYATEAEACLELLDRVTSEDDNFFELVAGPALPDLADTQFQAWLEEHSLSRDRLSRWRLEDAGLTLGRERAGLPAVLGSDGSRAAAPIVDRS